MKKWLVVGFVSCLFLSACSTKDTEDHSIQKTENDNIPLQQKDPSLESSKEEPSSQKISTLKAETAEIDRLKNEIATAVKKVESAKPSGTLNEKITQFRSFDNELEQLDHKLDAIDDTLELDYREKKITSEQYRAIDIEMDSLELQLEQVEDKLELTFGMEN